MLEGARLPGGVTEQSQHPSRDQCPRGSAARGKQTPRGSCCHFGVLSCTAKLRFEKTITGTFLSLFSLGVSQRSTPVFSSKEGERASVPSPDCFAFAHFPCTGLQGEGPSLVFVGWLVGWVFLQGKELFLNHSVFKGPELKK